MFVDLLNDEQDAAHLTGRVFTLRLQGDHEGTFVHAEEANVKAATRYDIVRTTHRRAFCLLHSIHLTSVLDLALIEHVCLLCVNEVFLECTNMTRQSSCKSCCLNVSSDVKPNERVKSDVLIERFDDVCKLKNKR